MIDYRIVSVIRMPQEQRSEDAKTTYKTRISRLRRGFSEKEAKLSITFVKRDQRRLFLSCVFQESFRIN